MKKFLFVLVMFFAFASVSHASEWNIPFFQEDSNTHTFIAINNPVYTGLHVTITLKAENGSIVYSERRYIQGGKTWFFDTVGRTLPPYGAANIFVEDSPPGVNMAITAMLYGQYNICLTATRY